MDFVIKFKYPLYQDNKIIWDAETAEDAVRAFWASFDYDDRKLVSDVKIFSLSQVEIKTGESILYKN